MTSIVSARACQLCGKPLSRIRVGTEGEFCSREHRNQFRLRQGMDRLMEANNVANLMRRRERPKSIMPNGLDSRAAVERRAYDQGPPMPVRSSAITDMRVPQASGEAVRLGQSRQGHIALVRFRVLGTEDARHEMQIQKGRFTGVFLLPRMRPGGVRSSDRGAAPARQIPMH